MAADYPMTVMPIVCSEEGTLCFYLNDRLVIGNRAKTELRNFHRRTIITSNNLHRVHDTHIFISCCWEEEITFQNKNQHSSTSRQRQNPQRKIKRLKYRRFGTRFQLPCDKSMKMRTYISVSTCFVCFLFQCLYLLFIHLFIYRRVHGNLGTSTVEGSEVIEPEEWHHLVFRFDAQSKWMKCFLLTRIVFVYAVLCTCLIFKYRVMF